MYIVEQINKLFHVRFFLHIDKIELSYEVSLQILCVL
jgi:hypothetical protein